MAQLREWLDLGRNTLSSLSTHDVTGLVEQEWPETMKMLVADHRAAIEREPRRIRRWVRTVNAVFFGLAKRLAPQRRLVFVIAQVAFFLALFSLSTDPGGVSVRRAVPAVLSFLAITFLLALELIDKIKIRDELTLARDLQASLIPKHPPQTAEYEIASFNHIANTVGGDIYDFVPFPDGRLAVLFGDASGHGMAAGLVMAVAHAAFRTQLDIDPSPQAITSSLNRILCRTGGSRSFFSCCYLLIEPDGRYVATMAGHPEVLKIDASGRVVERVGRGAYPLGVKSGLRWEVLEGSLAPDDRLLLHSDGLTEARNREEREFGDSYVEAIAGWHPGGTAGALIDDLVTEWRFFTGGTVIDDDVSVAVVRRRNHTVA